VSLASPGGTHLTRPALGPSTYRYCFAGLRIASEIVLDGLEDRRGDPEPGADTADVTVRRGAIPVWLVEMRSAVRQEVAPDEQLCFAATARYWMHGGTEIVVEEFAPTPDHEHALVILGTCLTGVCIQRGRLVLHASTVLAGDHAVAFTGRSGAGKSTIAACLDRRGMPLLADDVTVVDPVRPGHRPTVRAGIRRSRLLDDAIEQLDLDAAARASTSAHGSKLALPAARARSVAAAPLSTLVVLSFGPGLRLERVGARGRTAMLSTILHLPRRALRVVYCRTTTAEALRVLAAVDVFLLVRPPDLRVAGTVRALAPILSPAATT
jgi:hypothetical protein